MIRWDWITRENHRRPVSAGRVTRTGDEGSAVPDSRGPFLTLAVLVSAGFLLPAAPPLPALLPRPDAVAHPGDTLRRAARFDLWIYGRGLEDGHHDLLLKRNPWTGGGWESVRRGESAAERDPPDHEDAAAHRSGADEGWGARVVGGLPRSRFLGQDLRVGGLTLKLVAGDTVRVAAVFAMPHRLPADSGTADSVASLLERARGRVRAASLAHHVYPHPVSLGRGDTLVLRVEGRVRDRKPGVLEVEWLDLLWRSGG